MHHARYRVEFPIRGVDAGLDVPHARCQSGIETNRTLGSAHSRWRLARGTSRFVIHLGLILGTILILWVFSCLALAPTYCLSLGVLRDHKFGDRPYCNTRAGNVHGDTPCCSTRAANVHGTLADLDRPPGKIGMPIPPLPLPVHPERLGKRCVPCNLLHNSR